MNIKIDWPMLQGEHDGYDENGLWCGMTPGEVEAFRLMMKKRGEERAMLYHCTPPERSRFN